MQSVILSLSVLEFYLKTSPFYLLNTAAKLSPNHQSNFIFEQFSPYVIVSLFRVAP